MRLLVPDPPEGFWYAVKCKHRGLTRRARVDGAPDRARAVRLAQTLRDALHAISPHSVAWQRPPGPRCRDRAVSGCLPWVVRAGQAVVPASWPASLICSMTGVLAAASLRSWRKLAKPNSPARKETVPRPKATREMM
jgi:hypothetical protein